MKIDFRPMDQPADAEGVCVGTLDGQPLVIRDRRLFAGGGEYDQAAASNAYVEAVDRAASEIFGSEWVSPLARLMQINRRSTAKDRIAKFGLPTYVLLFLGEASHHQYPRALGHFLLGVEVIQTAHGIEKAVPGTGRPLSVDVAGRGLLVADTMRTATAMIDEVLAARELFRTGTGER